MPSEPWQYRLYRQFWLTLDWIFPPRCVGCGRIGVRFCDDCLAAARRITPPVCARCGNPLPAGETGLCPRCREHLPAFAAARSWALMEGSVRKAVHRLKYHRDVALADVLAAQLLRLVRAQGWEIDAVVAIPLGKQRLRERGYNQAALLAFPLALGLGVPFWRHALSRQRETRSQVGLSAEERRQNVAGAFAAEGRRLQGRVVLLVDDVMTTGATLDAAAQALLAAGAARVYAATVARAALRKNLRVAG